MNQPRLVLSLSALVIAGSWLYSSPEAQGAASQAGANQVLGRQPDSIATIERLEAAADTFVRIWRYAWEISDRYRDLAVVTGATNLLVRTTGMSPRVAGEAWPPPPGIDTLILTPEESSAVILATRGSIAPSELPRRGLLHCHPTVERNSLFERYDEVIIETGVGKRAVCPSWYDRNRSLPWDEAKGLDNSLVEPLVPRVRDRRASLIMLFDAAARMLPGDPWVAGQRVRFTLDQGDTAHALKAIDECRAEKWWCTALAGYVRQISGQDAEADSIFQNMLSLMPAAKRCDWTDYGVLLDDDDFKKYLKLSCAGRDSLAQNFWWLSDPEYGDTFNERRAAHFARRVMYELRMGAHYHERWDMRLESTGPAMFEMLVRYGWPNVSIWGGAAEDANHFGYLGISDATSYNHGRFATAEYSQPRAHTVPQLDAILDPVQASAYDWILTDSAYKVISNSMRMWWPIEHFERAAGPMVQIWSQHGLFRRQDSAMLALSTSHPKEDYHGAAGDTLRGNLYLATAPGAQRVLPRSAVVGKTSFGKTLVGSEPQLLSLELHSSSEKGVLGRTRFGIQPPQPLAALAPREIAISAPVFVRPATQAETDTDTPETVMPRMYTSTHFDNVRSIGLYWETYGFTATDTAALTVKFVRYERPGGIFTRFLRGFGGAKGQIAIEWKEVARPLMMVPSGAVPIIGRSISVDISELEPGDYSVVVTAARPGGVATVGESMIRVVSARGR